MKVNRPSSTARKVAFNIIALGRDREIRNILPDDIVSATENLLEFSGAAKKGTVEAASKMAWVYKAFDGLMPGQFHAFGYRKVFCEKQVRRAISQGAQQVLTLGAGYDTLGWRLSPEFENINFFEIDHPATAQSKALGIKAMGTRKNLYLIPEDLSEKNLVLTLADTPQWDSNANSIIVAEGLLMYLSPGTVKSLFKQCAATAGEGSNMVFTYVGRRRDGRPDAGPLTGLVLQILKWAGEPWLWSCDPMKLNGFLNECGWKMLVESSIGSLPSGIERFASVQRSIPLPLKKI